MAKKKKEKKEDVEEEVAEDTINAKVIKKLHKDYGVSCIMPVEEVINEHIPIIKTLPSLNMALGGGVMTGQMVQIAGAPKIGKTTLSFEILADFLRQFPDKRVYYYNVEGRFNKDLLNTIDDVALDRIRMVRSTEKKIFSGIDYLDILEKLIENDRGCLHVVDSVGGLVGDLEMSNTMADQQRGELAKMLGKFARRNAETIPRRGATLLMLNHVREKMKTGAGGGGTYSPGGKHYMHALSTDLELKMAFPNGRIMNGADEQIGVNVQIIVKTTPLGDPFKKVILPQYFGKGFKKLYDVVNIAEEVMIIEQAGAWFNYKETKWQGRPNMLNALENDKDLFEQIKNDVNDLIGGADEAS